MMDQAVRTRSASEPGLSQGTQLKKRLGLFPLMQEIFVEVARKFLATRERSNLRAMTHSNFNLEVNQRSKATQ